MQLKKTLDGRGIAHYILPAIVVIGVGVVGTMVLHFAHADQATPQITDHWHVITYNLRENGYPPPVEVDDCRVVVSDSNWSIKGRFVIKAQKNSFPHGLEIDEIDRSQHPGSPADSDTSISTSHLIGYTRIYHINHKNGTHSITFGISSNYKDFSDTKSIDASSIPKCY